MTAFSTIWRGVRPENRGGLRKREGRSVLGIGFTPERGGPPSENMCVLGHLHGDEVDARAGLSRVCEFVKNFPWIMLKKF